MCRCCRRCGGSWFDRRGVWQKLKSLQERLKEISGPSKNLLHRFRDGYFLVHRLKCEEHVHESANVPEGLPEQGAQLTPPQRLHFSLRRDGRFRGIQVNATHPFSSSQSDQEGEHGTTRGPLLNLHTTRRPHNENATTISKCHWVVVLVSVSSIKCSCPTFVWCPDDANLGPSYM